MVSPVASWWWLHSTNLYSIPGTLRGSTELTHSMYGDHTPQHTVLSSVSANLLYVITHPLLHATPTLLSA